jgi:hypothetical protein
VSKSHLRVEITLVRFEIPVVTVVITFVRLNIKIHFACRNHTQASHYHTRECHIYKYTCQNYSGVSENHTLRVKSHSACGNYTLRVEINLMSVAITPVRVGITFMPMKITLRVEITL